MGRPYSGGRQEKANRQRWLARRAATGRPWKQRATLTNLDALMSHVVMREECWQWTGAFQANGYGHTRWGVAHRAVFEAFLGQVAAGMELDHLCRNRGCVNPGHLEQVDRSTNIRRGFIARRSPNRTAA